MARPALLHGLGHPDQSWARGLERRPGPAPAGDVVYCPGLGVPVPRPRPPERPAVLDRPARPAGLPVLLAPPGGPHLSAVLGSPRHTPLVRRVQPDRPVPAVGPPAALPVRLVPPAGRGRLPAGGRPPHVLRHPALRRPDSHAVRRPAGIPRVVTVYPVAPPGPPRDQPPIPGQEPGHGVHRLGPAVRHLCRGDGRGAVRAAGPGQSDVRDSPRGAGDRKRPVPPGSVPSEVDVPIRPAGLAPRAGGPNGRSTPIQVRLHEIISLT